ncbi:metalloregulator ArsR/SmtB family transcription factor [Alicyclobacillus sp. SO9]|uniref:ArsR/SmtB family transcription factor n=1 Tax=Alicyclobacillus sp. SO9 TaxID=2665646 RepID=UPI0018E8BC71|nr:metalloregulator ArsR/SmtB family transcription factor [Alicyclobacillus sp. SO9]QQE81592.1 winged helix-turn-helix transcriptional regulator [Alicyclobacillus sp. SO9]
MTSTFEELAEVYKALADKTRLHMIALLALEELCVCELVAIFDMSQPAISQHLRKLKQAGLVKERKTAQWVYYSLDNSKFSLLQNIVDTLPDVENEIELLKSKGLRVQCTL